MKTEELIKDSKDCCGCLMCASVCPVHAISIREDTKGFVFPVISPNLCIDCKKCIQLCEFKKETGSDSVPISVYGAANANDAEKDLSSSGGLFYIIAKRFLENTNGVVYGAAYTFEDDYWVSHIRVDVISDLYMLQGSKYVQSNTWQIYDLVKKDLLSGKVVLFSGTPCQIAAVKAFTRGINQGNLYTIDIICHGVPNQKLFKDYLSFVSHNNELSGFTFRDKSQGWAQKGKIEFLKNGKKKSKNLYIKLNAYYQYYMNGDISRDSCYNCKYCASNREGDITLGDYWGVERYHSDQFVQNGGQIDPEKGVSCVLINTQKGLNMFNSINRDDVLCFSSTLDNLLPGNPQLTRPAIVGPSRDAIFHSYIEGGYQKVNTQYIKKLGAKYYAYKIYYYCPSLIKKQIGRLLSQ